MSSAYSFTKNKNFLELNLGKKKPYLFNINTGELIGTTGQPLKTEPQGFRDLIKQYSCKNNVFEVIDYLYKAHVNNLYISSVAVLPQVKEYFIIADKMESIGYSLNNVSYSCSLLLFADKHWKAFLDWVMVNPRGDLSKFQNDYNFSEWLFENNLKINDYFTEPMAKTLYSYRSHFTKKNIKWAAYYLAKGLYEFFYRNPETAMHRLVTYFELCDMLEQIPQKGDFLRLYVEAQRNYNLNKETFDNKKLYNNQMKRVKSLAFENEEFCVVIPTTTQEFINEGKAQDNCVARIYMPKVIADETNIVFIRKKSEPNQSYITCEVYNGVIWQYLEKYNERVTNEKAIAFQVAYQNHLNKTWNKAE